MWSTTLGSGCGDVRVLRLRLSSGDAGIRETVQWMQRLIRESMGHPAVRVHTERAVEGILPGRPLEELRAVYKYVAENTEYRRDPENVEYLQAPWWVLQCGLDRGHRPQLDCDDLTDLSLAMLGSIGYPTTIRVVSRRPDREYNHVYGLAGVNDLLIPFDLTMAYVSPQMPRKPETRAFEVAV